MAEYYNQQIMARELQTKGPTKSIDETLTKNYQIGIVDGLRLALQLPNSMMEMLRGEFTKFIEAERNGS